MTDILKTREDLKEFLNCDSRNFQSQRLPFLRRLNGHLCSTPISEQKYIWRYIYALRHVEYYQNNSSNIICKIMMLWWLRKLRKYSHITGIQLPPYLW